jgi:hypothetical protein
MSTKYISKPNYVEAVPVFDVLFCAANDWKGLPKWVVDAYDQGRVLFTPKRLVYQESGPFGKNAWKEADDRHMLALDSKGELIAYDKDIFHKYYDKVEEK